METEAQRHAKLIKLLNESGLLNHKYLARELSINPLDLDPNEINAAVRLLTDFLHIGGGSSGDISLYNLLQKYFKDPAIRGQINSIVG